MCPGCGRNEIHKACPAHGTPYYMSGKPFTVEVELQYLRKNLANMKETLRDIATNYDCDEDAHRYNTPCRECEAKKALNKLNEFV